MNDLYQFVADHEVVIGVVGTVIGMLAAIVGYGRRHTAAMDERNEDRARNAHGPGAGSRHETGRLDQKTFVK